jgi:hypothetical protein
VSVHTLRHTCATHLPTGRQACWKMGWTS